MNDFLHGLGTVVVGLAGVSKRYRAFLYRKERVVFADHNVAACHDYRTALADDDRTRLSFLTRVKLGSEVFWI